MEISNTRQRKLLGMAIFLGGCLMTSGLANVAPQGILLRRTSVLDATDTYKIESTTKQTMTDATEGDSEYGATLKCSFSLKVKKVGADQSANIEGISKVTEFHADSAIPDAPEAKKGDSATEHAKIDVQNNLDIDDQAKTNFLVPSLYALGTNGFFVEFPDKPVAIGDTWKIHVPKSAYVISEDQDLKAKLVKEKLVGERPAYVLSVTGTVMSKVDYAKMMRDDPSFQGRISAGTKIISTGKSTLEAEVVIEKSTGRTLSLTAQVDEKLNLDLNDGMKVVPTVSRTTLSATLEK